MEPSAKSSNTVISGIDTRYQSTLMDIKSGYSGSDIKNDDKHDENIDDSFERKKQELAEHLQERAQANHTGTASKSSGGID